MSDSVIHPFEFVVIGGGLAGSCAAIAAARLGVKTALVQDRPVLGGNASSEVRVALLGAGDKNPWAEETGIISEYMTEERAHNHEWIFEGSANSITDLVLLELVRCEPNISLFLNTSVRAVEMAGRDHITAVHAVQLATEKTLTFSAPHFCDATGDGTVAFLAGAEYRLGREAASEFGESLAPQQADSMTMGSSLLFRAREMPFAVPFRPPTWAATYRDEESLHDRIHYNLRGGYWWIEVGGWYETIGQNDAIRDELLRHVLGVWDHIKNRCVRKEQAANWALEWVGMIPGKRESRRFMGDHILIEDEVKRRELFPDRVAYCGWYFDLHTMGGILAMDQPPEPLIGRGDLIDLLQVLPASIPYRCLYTKRPDNLFLAGRDISVSHVALGSTRVMNTCAVIGQAVGTAAALCLQHATTPRGVYERHIDNLQQLLIKNDCFIPSLPSSDPDDLARTAHVSTSSTSSLRCDMVGPLDEHLSEFELQRLEHEQRIEGHEIKYVRKLDAVQISQLFPVGSERLDSISLYVISEREEETELYASLSRARDIWDFSEPGFAFSSVRVPAHHSGWLKIPFGATIAGLSLCRVEIQPEPGLRVAMATGTPTAVVGAWKPPRARRWRWLSTSLRAWGVLAMRIAPDNYPYGGSNATSGVARPEAAANIWISDPDQPLPQWLELSWTEPHTIAAIHLKFDINLIQVARNTPPLCRKPECVRDYTLEAWQEGKWKVVYEEKGNYHRHRICILAVPVTTDHIRLVVYATNGDPSARLYEIRAYAPPST